jgi:uncharacterized protein YfaS (alpha-2-macroglobulin family)
MASGEPVPAARVAVYRATGAIREQASPPLDAGTTDSDGVCALAGLSRIDPQLQALYGHGREKPRLWVRVEKGADLAVLPLAYPFQVDTFRASRETVASHMRRRFDHLRTWGATAQGVYKAGDRVAYKLYVRDQSNDTLMPAPRDGYRLEVQDPLGKIVHTVAPLRLSSFGSAHGEFTVPPDAPVGWYRFRLSATFSEQTWEPLQVLISDFSGAAFGVDTELNGDLFRTGDTVEVTTLARRHSGGPYTQAGARVSAYLESRPFQSPHPGLRGFRFDVRPPSQEARALVHQAEADLDDQGRLLTRFTVPEEAIVYGRLAVESAVRDDRGSYVTNTSRAAFSARDRLVGVRQPRWSYAEDQPARFDIAVVDETGLPRPGVAVRILVERRLTRAARVKGPGNAYITRYVDNWEPVSSLELTSEAEPVACRFTPPDPGGHRLTANVEDTRGRRHATQVRFWVTGRGRVLWHAPPDHSLEIVARTPRPQTGTTARYLIKNPFPGALALVTVERYGVLRHWVRRLETSTPLVEVPIDSALVPGFYLSVVVMSPRVAKPPGENRVDLGKPAFRMGYAKVPVTDPDKRLSVTVTPESPRVKPGERVAVALRVDAGGADPAAPVELAVAVLDESVLDLLERGSEAFDPYGGLYRLDALDLQNYCLLTGLVGRQKFEKKGASAGGDGGTEIALRSVFKFVGYWNPSLVTDNSGRARFAFDAPDNLTGWRILVMAVTPGDRMGLGEGRIEVTRPTEIRAVMPNQVTAGDRFEAGFDILNRTSLARTLEVELAAEGSSGSQPPSSGQTTRQQIVLAPFGSKTVWLTVESAGAGEIRFTARAGDARDRDGLVHRLPVRAHRRPKVTAVHGTLSAPFVEQPVHSGGGTGQEPGELAIRLAPSLIGGLEGPLRYLRDYPYTCWEQRLTKAVMASSYDRIRAYLPPDFVWEGSRGQIDEILALAGSYQTPDGAMAYYRPEAGRGSPFLSAYTALAFNWLRHDGHTVSGAVEGALLDYLSRLLRHELQPDFYSRGMMATVRAMAVAALAPHGRIERSDLERACQWLTAMDLFGRAHLLLATLAVPETGALRARILEAILAAADESAAKLVFKEPSDPNQARILSSPLRSEGALLSALVAGRTTPEGRPLGELPVKLARQVGESLGVRDHWPSTQENVYCLRSLVAYQEAYEPTAPQMAVRVTLDGRRLGGAHFEKVTDPPITLHHALSPLEPQRRSLLRLQREGQGRLYWGLRLTRYGGVPTAAVNTGIEVGRRYAVAREGGWLPLTDDAPPLSRGDLVRAELTVSTPAARHFVVVDDPVPGALEPVNTELATASRLDAAPAREKSEQPGQPDEREAATRRAAWYFYHRELRHDAARFYCEVLPPGRYLLAYTARVVATGTFTALSTTAMEMYHPDVGGAGKPFRLRVAGGR